LADELLEAAHDPLHDPNWRVLPEIERGIKVHLVASIRRPPLTSGYQPRSGFERQRGRATGHERAAAEEIDLDARAVRQVAEKRDNRVGLERREQLADGGPADRYYFQS